MSSSKTHVPPLTKTKINSLLVKELKVELRKRNLSPTGLKAELQGRLLDFCSQTELANLKDDMFDFSELDTSKTNTSNLNTSNLNMDDVQDFEKALYELEHGISPINAKHQKPEKNGKSEKSDEENAKSDQESVDSENEENESKTDTIPNSENKETPNGDDTNTEPEPKNLQLPADKAKLSELENEFIKQSRIQRFGKQVIPEKEKLESRKRRFQANSAGSGTGSGSGSGPSKSDFSLSSVLNLENENIVELQQKLNERRSKFGLQVDFEDGEGPAKKRRIDQSLNLVDQQKLKNRMKRFGMNHQQTEKLKIESRKKRFASLSANANNKVISDSSDTNNNLINLDVQLGHKLNQDANNELTLHQTLDEIASKQKQKSKGRGRGSKRRGGKGNFRGRGRGRGRAKNINTNINGSFTNTKNNKRKKRLSDF